jgi:hypothetical protein
MNLVDLFAIAPFYIELLLAGDVGLSFLRMLRMTRIFRVLKVGSFAGDLQIFVDGMALAQEGLALLGFVLMLYLCVFGSFLYMIEHEVQADRTGKLCCPAGTLPGDCDGAISPHCPMWARGGFTSIPTTWYFILATVAIAMEVKVILTPPCIFH